jgi:hypothetical protein
MADECIRWIASDECPGDPLDPWQVFFVREALAMRGGELLYPLVVLRVARQQGKTFAFEVACLADLFLFGGPDQLIIWTAHLFPTANEAFIDLKAIVDEASGVPASVLEAIDSLKTFGPRGATLHHLAVRLLQRDS